MADLDTGVPIAAGKARFQCIFDNDFIFALINKCYQQKAAWPKR